MFELIDTSIRHALRTLQERVEPIGEILCAIPAKHQEQA
jgi:hypothetical protein